MSAPHSLRLHRLYRNCRGLKYISPKFLVWPRRRMANSGDLKSPSIRKGYSRFESERGYQISLWYNISMKEYQHHIWCSAPLSVPRKPGSGCSCYKIDLYSGKRLGLVWSDDYSIVTRTIWVSKCPECNDEVTYIFDPPKERYCSHCSTWVKVNTISWTGIDFSKYLKRISFA